MTEINVKKELIDIANQESNIKRSIQKVGMKKVECPIQIESEGKLLTLPAICNASISLDDVNKKGIHMSRLYRTLQESLVSNPLSKDLIHTILSSFIDSHSDLSSTAYLDISFDYMIKQKALKSELSGYRYYPITISANHENGKTNYSLTFTITYSSTCPCSAALARQVILDKFQSDFSAQSSLTKEEIENWLIREESICATPHAQRSTAKFSLDFSNDFELDIQSWIQESEFVIQTAVQALVKREDEQEFAIKNGQNLMFCEDAVRRFDAWLDTKEQLRDYKINVDHFESLHPHNASAETSKSDR